MAFTTIALAQQPRKPVVAPKSGPTYEQDIRPLFAQQCLGCHNRSQLTNVAISGGLALDDYGSAKSGVKGHAVVIPNEPDQSSLIVRLESNDLQVRMPKGGDPLPPAKIALVRRWIEAGAPRGTALKAAAAPASKQPPAPALEVDLPTQLPAPPDLLPPGAPKDAKLSWSLKVGPLPPVTSLAYSPDGKTLAIGTYRAVLLLDVPGGRITRVLTDPIGTVQSLCWSKDGSLLAAAGGSPSEVGQVLLYDVAAGFKPTRGFAGHTDVIYSVALSPDGKTMATASQDKTVRTWDIPGRKAGIVIRAHSDVVYRVRFAPNGSSIFTCGQDRAVRQFETATGKLIRSFEGHTSSVTALGVRPDGQVIVTAGVEPRLRWWNVGDGGTPRYSDGSSVQVNDIAFSPTGKLLAAAAGDHGVRVWNGENGGLMKQFMDALDWSYAVSISPDDKFVAGAGADGAVRIWEIQPGVLRATILFAPVRDNKVPEWAMIGEHGYLASSPGWQKLITLKVGEARCSAPRVPEVMTALVKPDLVQKSLHGEKVDPPVLSLPAKK